MSQSRLSAVEEGSDSVANSIDTQIAQIIQFGLNCRDTINNINNDTTSISNKISQDVELLARIKANIEKCLEKCKEKTKAVASQMLDAEVAKTAHEGKMVQAQTEFTRRQTEQQEQVNVARNEVDVARKEAQEELERVTQDAEKIKRDLTNKENLSREEIAEIKKQMGFVEQNMRGVEEKNKEATDAFENLKAENDRNRQDHIAEIDRLNKAMADCESNKLSNASVLKLKKAYDTMKDMGSVNLDEINKVLELN